MKNRGIWAIETCLYFDLQPVCVHERSHWLTICSAHSQPTLIFAEGPVAEQI